MNQSKYKYPANRTYIEYSQKAHDRYMRDSNFIDKTWYYLFYPWVEMYRRNEWSNSGMVKHWYTKTEVKTNYDYGNTGYSNNQKLVSDHDDFVEHVKDGFICHEYHGLIRGDGKILTLNRRNCIDCDLVNHFCEIDNNHYGQYEDGAHGYIRGKGGDGLLYE